jgi:dipeptidyl aminopeptidase/acylaminoacyl peptidase
MRTLLLLIASLLCGYAQDTPKTPITAADLLKIRNVDQVDVAPDGSYALFSVRSMFSETAKDGETRYGYRNHLWRVNLGGAAQPLQLTFGDRRDRVGALSPDGKLLAFIREENPPPGGWPQGAGNGPKPQVWLLRMDAPGEAEVVTKLENGVSAVNWHPNGKALLVTSRIPVSKLEGAPPFSTDRPGKSYEIFTKEQLEKAKPDGSREEIRAWLYKNAQKDNPTVINRLNFLGEQGLNPEMTIGELFLVELGAGNKATQLTKDFISHDGARFSPDGKLIAYGTGALEKDHPDRSFRRIVRVMNADGSGDHSVLDDPQRTYFFNRFTPDGSRLLFATGDAKEVVYLQTQLALCGLDGKGLRIVTGEWDGSPQEATFAQDGAILFTGNWHGGEPLLRVGTNGGAVQRVVDAPAGIGVFGTGGGRIVYSLISVANPNELYVLDQDGSRRRLTELNEGWLSKKLIVQPEEHWVTRPDGTKVQYWVMNPANAKAGQKYPWVLDMHGGPSAMWGPGEFSMWHEFQTLCAWGYGVVYSNPRGSSGYGLAFQKANYQNWGAGPAGDVLAALEETQKTNPMVDGDRLFLTGGSYAGYLTAWIVGHDNRFKAAAAQRGVYNLITFYGEGNAYRLVEGAFGGFPWNPETRKLLQSESPFTYVADIKTPLLILHASQDLRTGVTQSEMLFRALEQQRKPVEYIRYPQEGHELTRSGNPGRRMDHLLRIVEFFERYSANSQPAPPAN